jgi:hypothetical protein
MGTQILRGGAGAAERTDALLRAPQATVPDEARDLASLVTVDADA